MNRNILEFGADQVDAGLLQWCYVVWVSFSMLENWLIRKIWNILRIMMHRPLSIGHVIPLVIIEATILVLSPYVKSLQLIWKLGNRRFYPRIPYFQMSCRNITTWKGAGVFRATRLIPEIHGLTKQGAINCMGQPAFVNVQGELKPHRASKPLDLFRSFYICSDHQKHIHNLIR